jgi:hypothetical protein
MYIDDYNIKSVLDKSFATKALRVLLLYYYTRKISFIKFTMSDN